MPTPLLDALRAFAGSCPLRLDMPGHHGAPLPMAELSPWAAIDFTETTPTGDLFGGTGPILEAQDLWAKRWGGEGCLFLTGGSTEGIHTALTLTNVPGGTLLVDRGSHRSVYHAMALIDLKPIYLSRPWLAEGIAGPIDPAEVDRQLQAHPDCKTVCITSPTYYGVLSDISALSEVCRRHGAKLMVDCAHGAHLPWLGLPSPMEQGADLTVTSAHKGLPAPGQSGLLFYRGFAPAEVRRVGSIYGSSSPSYPMMAAMDWVRQYMDETGGADYQAMTARLPRLAEELKASGRMEVLLPRPGVMLDPARLVVGLSGISGQQAAAELERQNVYCEMCDRGHLVFILTCMDGPEALKRLKLALLKAVSGPVERDAAQLPPPPDLPQAPLTLRQALFAPQERLPLRACAGRVSACQIAPYPPGVPVIAPGEAVDKKHLAYLEKIGYNMEREVEMVQG